MCRFRVSQIPNYGYEFISYLGFHRISKLVEHRIHSFTHEWKNVSIAAGPHVPMVLRPQLAGQESCGSNPGEEKHTETPQKVQIRREAACIPFFRRIALELLWWSVGRVCCDSPVLARPRGAL